MRRQWPGWRRRAIYGKTRWRAWIAAQGLARLGPNVRYTVDMYHVCDCFAAVWPEERESVRLHRDHLKAGAIDEVLTALRAREEP